MDGNYVSQWCDFEFEELCELVNKVENSDKDSFTSALCETPWNNTWFLSPIDFCDDDIDLFVLQTGESEKQNIGVGLHKTVYEHKDTPVITKTNYRKQ